ncbi:MAG: radical SAM protein [Deltaproteobacteria bacterium]|nr:radical SAM protein [Deltaproteobacteria bacterium]
MRLLLVQPAWSDTHGSFSAMAKRHACVPPLGIGYLASLARKAGHEVMILDAEAERLTDKQAAEIILARKPEVVGLSATTPIYHKACNIARHLKKAAPQIITIIGGPHISVLGEEAFFPCFDLAVRGEAEMIFASLLQALEEGGRGLDAIPGVMLRRGQKVLDQGWGPKVPDLDTLPFPAWDLYDMSAYLTHVRGKGLVPYATMNFTRGCPFKCVFCAASVLEGKKLRGRSPRNVVAEVSYIKEKFNISHICFNDSTLTLRPDLIKEFCSLLLAANLQVTWEGWTRANLVDEELLSIMKNAGFVRISFGIETGSPRILKLIRKEVSHEDIRRVYRLTGKLGIEATCSAMMGHPGETEADVWETVRFIRSIPEIEYSPLSIAVPYPGTELYRLAKRGEHGLKLLSEDYSQYLRYAGGVMQVNGMSPKYLRKLQKKALLWMHLTPGKIMSTIRRFGFRATIRAVLGKS